MATQPISELDAQSLGSLSERYAVRSILGRGAFATVYLADDLVKGRQVVIKLLAAADASTDSGIIRFHAEVAATRLLQHRNLVRVLNDGVTSDHRPFLVTEYTPGRSLAAVLRESGKLSTSRAVDVGVGIARALTYVHSQKFVHRDLKPSNVLIPGWPEAPDYRNPKLLDFGVVGRLEQGRTQAGMIFGTLRYMSPEQIKGERQSAATDVYGFGLLLFEMLTGAAPSNRGRDLTTLLIAIRDGISDADFQGVEPDLADLIRRCVRIDPGERPAMAGVLDELENSPHRGADESLQGLMKIGFELPGGAAGTPPAPPAPAPQGAPAPPAAPSPLVAGAGADAITERTVALREGNEPAARPAGSASAAGGVVPRTAPVAGSRRWLFWTLFAFGAALLSIALIFFFRPAPLSHVPPREESMAPAQPSGGSAAAKPPVSSRSGETTARSIRFAAGILLMAASIAVGFLLRTWLGSRSQVKSQAYDIVFGARARTDLTATIALQLDELVSKLRNLDERILAGSVALMLNEYGSATDPKDRQAALMNVVALSEKLAVRLSPWYERYKEIIASAVAVMGGVSGLITALRSILAHTP